MSSDPQHSVSGLSSKFENEFTDVNRLLDTVIGKNSRTAAIVTGQDHTISETRIGTHEKPSEDFEYRQNAKGVGNNVFDKNVLQDLVRQSGLKESESNYTSRSLADTQVTPVKSRQAPSAGSTAELNRYGTPTYGSVFSSPMPEGNRQERREGRLLEPVQEIPFNLSRGEETTKAAPTQVQGNTDKCVLPVVKRDNNTTKLVDENLKFIHRDLHFSHKYAPEQVLRSIEKTPDGQFFLVDALNQEQKTLQESIKKYPNHKEDPIDQIVILSSPPRDIGADEKILSVYQQVSEVYNDNTSYIGEKFLGLRQGQGTYYFNDGYRYEGTWEDDQMSGFGILWIDDIKWYEGEWKEGTFHGKGIVYNLTPEEAEAGKVYMNDFNTVENAWEKYEGKFSKGSKHGFGTLTLTNGDTFTGNFESDNINGRGSYVKEGGKKLIPGVWENNVLKRAL